jgi:hypothetical protein
MYELDRNLSCRYQRRVPWILVGTWTLFAAFCDHEDLWNILDQFQNGRERVARTACEVYYGVSNYFGMRLVIEHTDLLSQMTDIANTHRSAV